MKEVLISVVLISVCTALLTTSLVGDKFKSNVRAVSSLILVLFVVSQLKPLDMSRISFDFDSDMTEVYMFESVAYDVEDIINKTVTESIIKHYTVNKIYVDTNGFFSENEYEIRDVTIKINSETPVFEILNHVEEEFGLTGKVTVVKITDEVEQDYEVE